MNKLRGEYRCIAGLATPDIIVNNEVFIWCYINSYVTNAGIDNMNLAWVNLIWLDKVLPMFTARACVRYIGD